MAKTETATFAGGCFWCTEAIFKRLRGVVSATPGFAGGRADLPNPTYEQVCTGKTGYAEAAQIEFDPAVISYETLLDVFWATIDPTTLNRQGSDEGTQYRSAIFYHGDGQRAAAEGTKRLLAASGKYGSPIVTEVVPFTNFYPADESHREFYERNRGYGYCRLVIDPKIQKLYKGFAGHLKEGF
jgi:peptide-methionine (S)-S-oxide reductase